MTVTSIKTKSEITHPSSGSYLKSNSKRRFLFLFGYSDHKGWWSKYITGFTHIAAIELLDNNIAIVFEPLFSQCATEVGQHPTREQLKDWTVLEVDIEPTNKKRLAHAVFQTCATVIQYIAGISFDDRVLVQEFHDTLIHSSKEYLKRNGIMRVEKWENVH